MNLGACLSQGGSWTDTAARLDPGFGTCFPGIRPNTWKASSETGIQTGGGIGPRSLLAQARAKVHRARSGEASTLRPQVDTGQYQDTFAICGSPQLPVGKSTVIPPQHR